MASTRRKTLEEFIADAKKEIRQRWSICRSMQLYKRYFKHEIDVWNKLKK